MALQRLADARDLGAQVAAIYRAPVTQPPEAWPQIVRDLDPGPGYQVSLEPQPVREELRPAPPEMQELIRPHLRFGAIPAPLRPAGDRESAGPRPMVG